MPKRSDSRARMIEAARHLFRERGYHGTAFSDVLKESGAPRGSVYFHFPGGKEELGAEVVLLHTSDTTSMINRAALRVRTPEELVREFVNHSRDRIAKSDYREGCAVAPIIVEMVPESELLSDAAKQSAHGVLNTLAARLTEKGLTEGEASEIAFAAVSGVEGALILARSLRSGDVFNALTATLERSVAQLRERHLSADPTAALEAS